MVPSGPLADRRQAGSRSLLIGHQPMFDQILALDTFLIMSHFPCARKVRGQGLRGFQTKEALSRDGN